MVNTCAWDREPQQESLCFHPEAATSKVCGAEPMLSSPSSLPQQIWTIRSIDICQASLLPGQTQSFHVQVTRHDALPLVIVDPAYQISQAESFQDFTDQEINWKCTDHDGKTKRQLWFLCTLNLLNDRSHYVGPNGQAVQFPQGAACPTIIVGIDVVNLTTARREGTHLCSGITWGKLVCHWPLVSKIGHLPGSNLFNHCKPKLTLDSYGFTYQRHHSVIIFPTISWTSWMSPEASIWRNACCSESSAWTQKLLMVKCFLCKPNSQS